MQKFMIAGFVAVFFLMVTSYLKAENKDTTYCCPWNSRQNIGDEHVYLALEYSNLFHPDYTTFWDGASRSGNNFYGIQFGPMVFISPTIYTSFDCGILLGNIDGNFAGQIFIKPTLGIWVGYLNVGVSTGIGDLSLKKSVINQYGGFGLIASLFINVNITKNILIGFVGSYQSYPNVNYNSLGLQVGYLFPVHKK